MPRRARIHYVSLHSSLVNLPISLYGPLLERSVRPQGLAVHLILVTDGGKPGSARRKADAYVGWTGMASASSLAQFNAGSTGDRSMETIEIDPQYAEGLGFALGDIVEIGLLHDLSYATTVATEPVTTDDWEILEIHASHVESSLLSQVRVAAVGQEIDVWVLGRTRVRLQVVSFEPSTKGKAALLTTNTEVTIAPKVRSKAGSRASIPLANGVASSGKAGKVNGTQESIASTKSEAPMPEKMKRRSKILRVLPARLLSSEIPDAGSETITAFVSRTTLCALSKQNPASTSLRSCTVLVQRIRSPSDPTAEQPSSAQSMDAAPAPRVLIPNGEQKDASETSENAVSKNEVSLIWSPEVQIPDGHIVLQVVVDGVEDWDIVRVIFIRSNDTIPTSDDIPRSLLSGDHKHQTSQHGLAGVNDILLRCMKFCSTRFALHAFSHRIRGVPGLLVTGRSGAGKTAILNTAAHGMQQDPKLFAYTFYVDFSKYLEAPIPKMRSLLKHWMDKAAWHRPTILVFDNIDKIMGTELEHADSFRARHLAELFLAIYGSATRSAAPNANGVVLLASAESQAALHPLLNSSHLFQEVVNLKPPGKDARRDIIAQLVRGHIDASDITEDPGSPLNFAALATQTEGYSVTDLKDFVTRAVHRAAMRAAQIRLDDDEDVQMTLTPEDFTAAQVDFVPLSLRDVKLQKSDVAWADIGGLRETKRVLRETLEWPTKYGPIFAQSPLRLRSGLLLYGYPGCGKTLLASAVARECGLNFISIKGPELLNKYIGASEKSVRDLFERASAAKPCVLFFDEFDSIAPKRGHDSTGVTDRVVNQMLTQMDGAEGLDGVYVLAATSRPDLIDSALLRPGRLDKSLLCDMPDVGERKEILEALGRKVVISPSVDLDELAHSTDGFSGADLQALVYNAHLEVIHESISSQSLVDGPNGVSGSADRDSEVSIEYTKLGGTSYGSKKVLSRAEESKFQQRLQRILSQSSADESVVSKSADTTPKKHEIAYHHLRRVLKTTRPSVPSEERERLSRIYRAFVSDRSGELPVPPDAGGVGSRVSLM
ncbi:AAA-domain-containing protein [Obba rivulosa]|uniref:Peroxisomal ATPase PEX1 n=1 Tax=Obba rivulosa TaxID=1052685 RepID=A0A8E2AHZ1_9APHY|nr:AAA-domain-containing protein [Obba rivulosa]